MANHTKFHSKIPTMLLIGLCAFLVASCKERESISTYTIPKEASTSTTPQGETQTTQPASAPQQASSNPGQMVPLPGMAAQSQAFDAPTFQAPNHWQAQPLGSMRKGSWKVIDGDASVDVSVIVFQGNVGGNLANVNRWRGQIGLPPVDEATLATTQSAIIVDALPGKYVSFSHAEQGVVGAIVPKDRATWFFKMIGPSVLVTQEQAAFKQFVEATQF